MTKRTLPGLGLTGFWNIGDDYKTEMDFNILMLSALVQAGAKSQTTNLPGSGALGTSISSPQARLQTQTRSRSGTASPARSPGTI